MRRGFVGKSWMLTCEKEVREDGDKSAQNTSFTCMKLSQNQVC